MNTPISEDKFEAPVCLINGVECRTIESEKDKALFKKEWDKRVKENGGYGKTGHSKDSPVEFVKV